MNCPGGRSTTCATHAGTVPGMRLPLLARHRQVGRPRPLAFAVLEVEELERAAEPNVRLLGPGEGLPDPLAQDQDDTVDAEVIELRSVRKTGAVETRAEVEVMDVNPAASLPAVRFERAVMALAWSAEVLAGRVERVEQRIDDIADQCFEGATQADLIEVETRRARLSMEVARMGIDLRGQMAQGLASLGNEMGALSSSVSSMSKAASTAGRSDDSRHEKPVVDSSYSASDALNRVTPMQELGSLHVR